MSNFLKKKNIIKFFKKKKILVTGGTGLIGRFVSDFLVVLGSDVTVVSLDNIKLNRKIKYIRGNLTNYNFCKKITKNIDYVFHLSGIKASVEITIKRPASFYVPLIMMNTNLLEACRLNKIKKLVYASSIGAYKSGKIFREKNFKFNSDPMDKFPGWAKRVAELQIEAYKKEYKLKNYFIVRPCNVYGPGDDFNPNNAMVIPTLLNKIRNGVSPVEIWGDGSAIRDFAYAEDVAVGILQTIYYGTKNYNFINLGSGTGVSIKALVNIINKVVKFDYKFNKYKNSGYSKRVMDISLAKKIIKYNPKTPLFEGIKKTWDWYNKNHKEFRKRHNYFADKKVKNFS